MMHWWKATEKIALLAVASIMVAACAGEVVSQSFEELPSPTADETSSTTFIQSAGAPGTTAATASAAAPAQALGDLPDPCSLLTAADIEAATGLPFGEGTFNTDLSSEFTAVCDWQATGAEYATAQVLILAAPGSYESNKAGTADVFGIVDVDIPGADAAYASEEGSLIGISLDGGLMQVAYIPPGPGNVLDQTKELATIALANY